jgi:hypothetical protein
VRGDAALTARLLLRGPGLAGVVVTLGGALAVLAATRPWYVTVAELSMLDDQQSRTVATLAGVPETVLGWVALALGIVAVVLGANLALDRPHPHARTLLLSAASSMVGVAIGAAVRRPALERVAGPEAEGLLELAGRLPAGVELTTWVRPGIGPTLLGVAAVLIGGGALGSRDR